MSDERDRRPEGHDPEGHEGPEGRIGPEGGSGPESAGGPPDAAVPGEYADQPTEELFALEARLKEGGEEVPDLDPVFRAALLETTESALGDDRLDHIGEAPAESGKAAEEAAQPSPGGESGQVQPAAEAPSGPGAAGAPGGATPDHGESSGELPSDDEAGTEEGPAEPGTEEWDAPSETGLTAEQTAVLQAEARSEVHEAIEFSRRTGRPWDPPRPPAGGDYAEPAKRPRYWWRFLLATLLIVGSFATATQASVMNIVGDLADRFEDKGLQQLPTSILPESNGGPQTIALIGSDVRTGGGAPADDPGRSDTAMLMRLDPDSGQIAMLSIPRDLYVEIPGYGYDKFNAAYSYGGVKLTLQTIRELTGLDINHVVNVDFQGFADVIDAIGCVFVDVDRKYFNDNSNPVEENYAVIDIEAGYQKLCGYDALDFARYRHTDSDLVRAARQQDLIGEVRNRLSLGEVIKRRDELLDAFAENTRSDISGSDEVLQLLKLLVDSRGAHVAEVSFPSTFTMRNGVSYVEATPAEIEAAVNKFLGFEDTAGPVGTLDEGDGASNQARRNASRQARQAARQRQRNKQSMTTAPGKGQDGLVDASQGGLDVAMSLDDEIIRTDFPVFYPKRLPEGTIYEEGSRVYHLRDPDKNVYGAFRMVMALQKDDGRHYFGLQGINRWMDPPILEAPHEEVEMDGRTFDAYTEGDRIRLISWTDDENVYWISNSLLLTLENQQMLGMARSTRAFTPGT